MTKTRRVERKIWRLRRRRFRVNETLKEYLEYSKRERLAWILRFKRWKRKKVAKVLNPTTLQKYPQRLFDMGHLDKTKRQIKRDGRRED